jgi:hypothetical protein
LTPLLVWVATLAGALLIGAGIIGSHPRPSDGQWQPLSPSVRSGLTMIGLVVILGGWAMNLGWFKTHKTVTASVTPRYSDARGDQPIDTLWNEAEAAQREARQHPKSQPNAPVASDQGTPTPALESAPVASAPPALAAIEPPTLPAAASAPIEVAAQQAAPAAVAAAPVAPVQTPAPVAAPTEVASNNAPACNCDQPQTAAKSAAPKKAAKPRAFTSSAPRVGSGNVVSVCALQQQYGIGAQYRNVSSGAMTYRSGISAMSLRVQDRLGPQQRREQLRITVEGGGSGTLNLSASSSSGSVSLRVPEAGARYRLSGYTEYVDGRRVPLSGEGFLDGGAQHYELRLADEFSGNAFLEPAT